jgi:hypothetical protein
MRLTPMLQLFLRRDGQGQPRKIRYGQMAQSVHRHPIKPSINRLLSKLLLFMSVVWSRLIIQQILNLERSKAAKGQNSLRHTDMKHRNLVSI